MLIGFFKPEVILPDREYSAEELQGILQHEITHLRRCDVVIKWLAAVACALHWFNPLVWLAQREIDRTCELSCDETVLRKLDTDGKQSYGDTLISVASHTKASRAVLSTTMCEEKKALKERLHSIMEFQKCASTTNIPSVCAILAAICLVCVLGAGASTQPAPLTLNPAEGDSANDSVMIRSVTPIAEIDNGAPTNAEPFYLAFFETYSVLGTTSSIPGVVMRFHGILSAINPDDFTDIVIRHDKRHIPNPLSFYGMVYQGMWGYEEVTDFYFAFEYENTELGRYSLTGRYCGELFTVSDVIIEGPVGDNPANPDDFRYATWTYRTDQYDNIQRITEVSFKFIGMQERFYSSDLNNLKLTRNGEEVKFYLLYGANRYLETHGGATITSFDFVFEGEGFDTPGTYILTGTYMEKPFTSMEITIS